MSTYAFMAGLLSGVVDGAAISWAIGWPQQPGGCERRDGGGRQDPEKIGAQKGQGIERGATLAGAQAAVQQVVHELHDLLEQDGGRGPGEARVGEGGMADVALAAVAHRVVRDQATGQRVAGRLEEP